MGLGFHYVKYLVTCGICDEVDVYSVVEDAAETAVQSPSLTIRWIVGFRYRSSCSYNNVTLTLAFARAPFVCSGETALSPSHCCRMSM
jgi:hypothetical protein